MQYTQSSPVPHRALKSNNHIEAPITHLRLGARSPTETTSQAQEPMHLPFLPGWTRPFPLRTLPVTLPAHHYSRVPFCNLRKKESISAAKQPTCPARARTCLKPGPD